MVSRRDFSGKVAAGLVGGALSACGGGNAATPAKAPTVLLVHGSWHGAWCFQPLIGELSARGVRAVAIDLPGAGLQARFPVSYFERPLNEANFASEISPVAGITLDDCANAIIKAIDNLIAGGSGPVVLVGHSFGGLAITLAAEKASEKIAKLVYITAYMPASGVSALTYIFAPENAGAELGALFKADPSVVYANRIDPNSADIGYGLACKHALCDDVSDDMWTAVRNLLTPDDPGATAVTPINTTIARWGSIPRAFIRCTRDNTIKLSLQDRFISEADAFTPDNPTQVSSLATSHSPFLAAPAQLADVLVGFMP